MIVERIGSRINSEGFTLTEVLVAMVVLMVGMLGFMQGINVVIEHNLQTTLRNEAITIADREMNAMRLSAYGSLDPTNYAAGFRNVTGTVRGKGKPYKVRRHVNEISTAAGTSSKEMKVLVNWTYKNVTTNAYEISSIRSQ